MCVCGISFIWVISWKPNARLSLDLVSDTFYEDVPFYDLVILSYLLQNMLAFWINLVLPIS